MGLCSEEVSKFPGGEYIFDLEHGVVIETPQLGHATYVFATLPRSCPAATADPQIVPALLE
jgi:hypothetical protein